MDFVDWLKLKIKRMLNFVMAWNYRVKIVTVPKGDYCHTWYDLGNVAGVRVECQFLIKENDAGYCVLYDNSLDFEMRPSGVKKCSSCK